MQSTYTEPNCVLSQRQTYTTCYTSNTNYFKVHSREYTVSLCNTASLKHWCTWGQSTQPDLFNTTSCKCFLCATDKKDLLVINFKERLWILWHKVLQVKPLRLMYSTVQKFWHKRQSEDALKNNVWNVFLYKWKKGSKQKKVEAVWLCLTFKTAEILQIFKVLGRYRPSVAGLLDLLVCEYRSLWLWLDVCTQCVAADLICDRCDVSLMVLMLNKNLSI